MMLQINVPVKILKNFKMTVFHFCFGFLCGLNKTAENESMLNTVFYFKIAYQFTEKLDLQVQITLFFDKRD